MLVILNGILYNVFLIKLCNYLAGQVKNSHRIVLQVSCGNIS